MKITGHADNIKAYKAIQSQISHITAHVETTKILKYKMKPI